MSDLYAKYTNKVVANGSLNTISLHTDDYNH